MTTTKVALSHLEDAEATLLSFMNDAFQVSENTPTEEKPRIVPMLVAVLRSIARAAGAIESIETNGSVDD